MPKERTPREIFESESMFSGAATALNRGVSLLKTYHAFDGLKEIEQHIKSLPGNQRPLRSVLVVADPLHFDELDYFRYKSSKLYHHHEFNYMRRRVEDTTSFGLFLTYNRGYAHLLEEDLKARMVKDNEDTVEVVAFPGSQCLEVSQVRTLDGEQKVTLSHAMTYDDLAKDPDRLQDALWDVFWSSPPLVNRQNY